MAWSGFLPRGAAASYPVRAAGKRRRRQRVRVQEKDRPAIEHPHEAIVRVTRAAICGSDLHLHHGMMPDTRVGMTFGHEFVGMVDEVGSSVKRLKVADAMNQGITLRMMAIMPRTNFGVARITRAL
ncbi:alcohol dehydrogenase catalytic domain-containing protein [Actinoplanes sp. NPDC049681]|uniref:alcohol dehydrogenase catalytic domain-containing protein n=1 Tax=Actinoplanes sp. NPDC049681 TaxID=3363905 RepID=UPI0037B5E5A3